MPHEAILTLESSSGADDRGGVASDTANYVLLAQELKAAFGSQYGISMTLPTSYWYLQHFDLAGIQQHIDWFNLMAYDLHGVWDAASKFVGPYIAPHTNITEIDLGMDLLWRAGVTPDRVVLGQGLYGRSFTLSSPSCNTPNGVCQFSGPANAGPCSNAPGILDKQEIDDIIAKNNLQPVWDRTSGVKWVRVMEYHSTIQQMDIVLKMDSLDHVGLEPVGLLR